MDPATDPPEDTPDFLLTVFPLALLAGALLALLHGWAAHAAELDAGQSAHLAGMRAFALSERWPEFLVEAVVAGLVSSLVLVFSAGRRAPVHILSLIHI